MIYRLPAPGEWLDQGDVIQGCPLVIQVGLGAHSAPAALLAELAPDQTSDLSGREQQQAPEVVAVVEVGEAALLSAAAEAVEGAEGPVLLGGAARCPAQGRLGAHVCGGSWNEWHFQGLKSS